MAVADFSDEDYSTWPLKLKDDLDSYMSQERDLIDREILTYRKWQDKLVEMGEIEKATEIEDLIKEVIKNSADRQGYRKKFAINISGLLSKQGNFEKEIEETNARMERD